MDEQREWIRSRRKNRLRFIAVVLCFCLLVTSYPDILATLFASAMEQEDGTVYVSGFGELPEAVQVQSVPLGTEQGELSLPDTLEAFAETESTNPLEETNPSGDSEEGNEDQPEKPEGEDGTQTENPEGEEEKQPEKPEGEEEKQPENPEGEEEKQPEKPEGEEEKQLEITEEEGTTPPDDGIVETEDDEVEQSAEEEKDDITEPDVEQEGDNNDAETELFSVRSGVFVMPVYMAEPVDTVEPQTLERKEETVMIKGVTWQSEPVYDGDVEETYIFTAVLPEGYALMDGVSLPQITVTVQDDAAVQVLLERIAALSDVQEYMEEEPDIDDWEGDEDAYEEAYEEWMEGLLAYAEEALDIWKVYKALAQEQQAQIPEELLAKLTAWMEIAEQAAGSTMVMAAATHTCNNITFTEWRSTTSLPTSGNYYLTADVNLGSSSSNACQISGTLNLCLNGHTISGSVSKGMIRVYGGTLNIYDCSASKSGKINCPDGNNPIQLSENGVLNLHGGTVQSGSASAIPIGTGSTDSTGGTVNVYSGATISGGTNGIYVNANLSNSHVNIYGGSISGGGSGYPVNMKNENGSVTIYADAAMSPQPSIYTVTPVVANAQVSNTYTINYANVTEGDTVVRGSTDTVHYKLNSSSYVLVPYGGNLIAANSEYTVALNGNGGSGGTGLTSYTTGQGAELPTDWKKTNYVFEGWYENADLSGTKVERISNTDFGDKTYYAKWTPVSYTITYDLDGGAVTGNPTSYTIESSAITLKNPTKTGYTFAGWSGTGLTGSSNTSVTIAKGNTGDRSYTAHWTANTYTITYSGLTGASLTTKPTQHTYGTDTKIGTPTKTGYTFAGWKINGAAATKTTTLGATAYTKDITLEATWTATGYTISYTLNSGTVSGNPTSYTIESNAITLKNPERTGYTFAGWSGTGLTGIDNTSVTIAKGSTGNRSYTANWTANTYTISYSGLTGASLTTKPTQHTYGTDTKIGTPTKTGYTFAGWKINGAAATKTTTLGATAYTTDITLEATWTAATVTIKATNCTHNGATEVAASGEYIVTFTPASGYKVPENLTVQIGGTTLASTQYTYDNTTGKLIISRDKITGNITITAAALLCSHNLTYKANNKTITESCDICGHSATATLSLKSNANLTYTGSAITPVTVTYSTGWTGSKPAISYTDNTNAGTAMAELTISGATVSLTFTISSADISGAVVTLGTGLTYNGAIQTQIVTSVTLNGKTLIAGTDYTVSGNTATNAGPYTLTITGEGNYTGTATKPFTIAGKSLTGDMVTLTSGPYEYTGQAITPAVTVKDGNKTLASGTDYTVSYTNNTNIGTDATVTVTGEGNYTGTVEEKFVIRNNSVTPPDIKEDDLEIGYSGGTITLPDDIKGEVEIYTDPNDPEGSMITPNPDGSLPVEPGDIIYVRYKEKDEANPASEGIKIEIPGRPAAPEPVEKEEITVTDTTITVPKLEDGKEYEYVLVEKGKEPDWSNPNTTGEFTDLDPNKEYDLYMREKATEDSFASEPAKTEIKTTVTIKEPVVEGADEEEGNIVTKPDAPDEDGNSVTYKGTCGEDYTPVIIVDGEKFTPEITWDEDGETGTWTYTVPVVDGKPDVEIKVEFKEREYTGLKIKPGELSIYADNAENGSMEALTGYLKDRCVITKEYDNQTSDDVTTGADYTTKTNFERKGATYVYTVEVAGDSAEIALTVKPVTAQTDNPTDITKGTKNGGYKADEVSGWLPEKVTVTYTGDTTRTESMAVTWDTSSIGANFGASVGDKTISGTVDLPEWATGENTVSICIRFADNNVLTDAQMTISISGWAYGAQTAPDPKGSVTVKDTEQIFTYRYSAGNENTWGDADDLPRSSSGYIVPGTYTVEMTYTGKNYTGVKTASFTVVQKPITVEKGTLAVENRNYDGTTNATLKEGGEPALSGVIAGDAVAVGGKLSAVFTDKGPKNDISVTVTGFELTGSDAKCYLLTNTTLTLKAVINNADGSSPSDGSGSGGNGSSSEDSGDSGNSGGSSNGGSSGDSGNSGGSSNGGSSGDSGNSGGSSNGGSSGDGGNGGGSNGGSSGDSGNSGGGSNDGDNGTSTTTETGKDSGETGKGSDETAAGNGSSSGNGTCTTNNGTLNGNLDKQKEVQQTEGTTGQSGQGSEAGSTDALRKNGTTQGESVQEGITVQTVQAETDDGRIVISGETTVSAVTGNLTEDSPVSTRLLVGDGTVIVTVVCAEGNYTAGTNDVTAVANAVLTPEQIQLVDNGETIEVRVDIKDISNNMPPQDMETVKKGCEAYGKYLPDLKLGGFVDISVYIKTGDSGWNAVTETREAIEVVIGIPEELRGDGREYYVIRAHEGRHDLLNDMDDVPETITVITDMFSSYAIAYRLAGTGYDGAETVYDGVDIVDGRAVCRLCHICPTFHGVCYFIWLVIIVATIILVVMILCLGYFCITYHRGHDPEKKKGN